jgi:hypothetical protein
MSLSDHRYVARIAPVSSTTADAVHSGATVLDERGERVTESFASGGLIWPNKTVPVLLEELSIVVAPNAPAYRGAKVTRITERETPLARLCRQRQERERAQAKLKPPKPAASPARENTVTQAERDAIAAGGTVFYGEGTILRRPGIGQVLGVR